MARHLQRMRAALIDIAAHHERFRCQRERAHVANPMPKATLFPNHLFDIGGVHDTHGRTPLPEQFGYPRERPMSGKITHQRDEPVLKLQAAHTLEALRG